MWKNIKNRKSLKSLYFTTYQATGLNQNAFINKLRKSGIELYNVKKKSNKRLVLTINSGKSEKFFAISKELCYNIKKIKDSGKFYPFLYLYRNVGIIIGVIIMIFSIVYTNDLIFSVDYSGSGYIYKTEAERILSNEGVQSFSRFSDFDLKTLSNKILSNTDKFSFVNLEKRGNRLNVYLALSNDAPNTLTGKEKSLVSTVTGEIESIKVYRGTLVKSVGDKVNKGDVIVDGYAVIGEEKITVNVIASVSVISKIENVYFSKISDQEKYFELLATEGVTIGKIVNVQSECIKTLEGYSYKIIVAVRHEISVG